MTEMKASVALSLTGNFEKRAKRYGRAVGALGNKTGREFGRMASASHRLGRALEAVGGKYTAMLGGAAGAYAATQAVIESAKLDKQLIKIRQTAGATVKQTKLLRNELHAMSEETGNSLDSLLGGFNSLIQAGQTWDQALVTIKAINPAMAVTGSDAETLASAIGVAGEAFKFDLSDPKTAISLIDQMTKAGRLGNAELEDLSSIFARVGVNAKSAGLGFSDTLGFIEQLSMIERNPERLATLVDSSLRLFTDNKYMSRAAKATGVSFYNAEGDRRAAFDVLDDIAAKYKKLKTDQQREGAIEMAFGDTDADTVKGLRTLLAGDAIAGARAKTKEIRSAAGTISKDLQDALSNSVDQVSRLRNALKNAADDFAQPINDAVENAIKNLLDEQKVSGKDILMGGAGAAALGIGLAKGGGKLLQRAGGVGAGVAAGKALEEVAGVTPVYVVNMPGGGIGGGSGRPGGRFSNTPGGAAGRNRRLFNPMRNLGRAPVGSIGALGAGAMGAAALGVAAAAAAGYGLGTLINDNLLTDDGPLGSDAGRKTGDAIGEAVAKTLAFFGNEQAQRAVAANEAKGAGTLKIEVNQEGRITAVKPQRGKSGPEMDVDLGLSYMMP